jgi:hypothetical protein
MRRFSKREESMEIKFLISQTGDICLSSNKSDDKISVSVHEKAGMNNVRIEINQATVPGWYTLKWWKDHRITPRLLTHVQQLRE